MTKPTTPLSQLAPKLRELGYGELPPGSYRRMQTMAAEGRLPGAVRINGRIHVEDEAVPDVGELLGLTRAPDAA